MISCAFHVPTPAGREEGGGGGEHEADREGEDEGRFRRLREVERSPPWCLWTCGLLVEHRPTTRPCRITSDSVHYRNTWRETLLPVFPLRLTFYSFSTNVFHELGVHHSLFCLDFSRSTAHVWRRSGVGYLPTRRNQTPFVYDGQLAKATTMSP